MALAQVWNDNIHPHTEIFKQKQISIPPKSFIEMDLDEAYEFKSQFSPILHDGENNALPTSFKMIRVVPLEKVDASVPLVCHATGRVASSPEELAKWNADHTGQLEEASRKHLEDMASLKAERDALAAKLAQLETKKAPGRPRKES